MINNHIKNQEIFAKPTLLNFDAKNNQSEVLKRLIAEVQHDSQNNISAYNRTHNRHNRGR